MVTRYVNRVGGKALFDGIYYFSTDDGSQEGSMATGKVTVNDEGDKYTYYFAKDGRAYTNTLIKGAPSTAKMVSALKQKMAASMNEFCKGYQR